MNLLVGVLCEDGVVVGSAHSGGASTGGFDPVEEPWANTFAVDRDLILAGTGRSGLGQRFADVVTTVRSDSRFTDWTGLTIAKTICAEAAGDFASTRCDKGQFGAIVAYPSSDGLQLCEFTVRDLQPELKTADRWFATMGAGRPVANPFLGFLQRVFFPRSCPALNQGVFVATWALDYAAGSGSGAAGTDLQMAVLTREAPDMPFRGRLLSARELSDWLADVRACEKHLAVYRRRISRDVGFP